MSKEFSTYYDRYLKLPNKVIQTASISASEWLKETPLKSMLGYCKESEQIELRIDLVQNTISYGLPMLLKPIYDIKAPNQMFLRFIEIGAYRPITRKMIELNIPRETALSLTNQYFKGINPSPEDDVEEIIIKRLRKASSSMEYWELVQIEGII